MALFSWLARGLAAHPVPGGLEEPPRSRAQKAPGGAAAVPLRPSGEARGETGAKAPSAARERAPRALPSERRDLAAAKPGAESVEFPLANVLECVPLLFLAGDAEKLVASAEARSRTVRLPLQRLLAQLPSGRVEFRFGDLRVQIPEEFLSEEARGTEEGEVPILLDLAEVVKRLPSVKLARRDNQVEVGQGFDEGVPDLLKRPEKRPVETPLRETARLAMAASSMPILPGASLELEGAGPKAVGSVVAKPPGVGEEPLKEILLPGAAPVAVPGAEPVSPAEPLFVRRVPAKPLLRRVGGEGTEGDKVAEKAEGLKGVAVSPVTSAGAAGRAPAEVPGTGAVAPGDKGVTQPAVRRDRPEGKKSIESKVEQKVAPLLLAPPKSRAVPSALPAIMAPSPSAAAKASTGAGGGPAAVAPAQKIRLRSLPRARVPGSPPLVERAAARVVAPGSERALAAGALARWLGVGPGHDILIREIPGILTQLPGVSGAIISDSEALTVARQLPPGIPEEAISSSASLLYKRLRHAANELGGGFTNQTLVGLGQWTLVITCEPPFFLTTVHATHVVPERLAMRMRKVARALARLEAARPIG